MAKIIVSDVLVLLILTTILNVVPHEKYDNGMIFTKFFFNSNYNSFNVVVYDIFITLSYTKVWLIFD
jgi:hypothetical protein